MFKARNRKLSMLIVLAMLMTMFIGVGTASAAATFTTLSAPIVDADGGIYDLGTVKVQLEDVEAIPADGAWLTISIPSGCEYTYEYAAGTEIISTDNISIGTVMKSEADVVEILVVPNYAGGNIEGSIIIKFLDIKVNSGSGDIIAKFLSNNSVFGTMNTAVIGKIGNGTTIVMAKSVRTMLISGGRIDTLIIAETIGGVFENGEIIEVKLPVGFCWSTDDFSVVSGAWSLSGSIFPYYIDDTGRVLSIYLFDTSLLPTSTAGCINIGSSIEGAFMIDVEDTAMPGEVYVTVSSDQGAVEEQNILVAEYIVDYGDVNDDKSINSSDHQRLFEHLNGTKPLSGYAITVGDVNKDGNINSSDHQRLFEHLNGTNPLS